MSQHSESIFIQIVVCTLMGVESFLNPEGGGGNTVRGIICKPGLNRVN